MKQEQANVLLRSIQSSGVFRAAWQAFVLVLMAAAVFPASAAAGQLIPNNTPGFVKSAPNLGPANPAEVIDVSIWLNLHNRSGLDSLAAQLYNPTSPNYQKFLQNADFVAQFAPTAQEVKTVSAFLTSHNLAVVAIGPDNFYVRAQGTIAAFEQAFQVQIDTFNVNGTTYRANTSDPYVDDPAAALTAAVYGLDNLVYQHPVVVQPHPTPNSAMGVTPATGSLPPGFFTSDCFTGSETQSYTLYGTTGTYTGNTYNGTENAAGCGYTPQEIYTAYDLTLLYDMELTGKGQTIVIIDWCGSPTILSDANAFSAMFGLPALTSSNFQIIATGPSTCAGPDVEINLDVEWAHAIAPGANIDLVVPPSATFDDVDGAVLYAITNNLGHVISGSYASEELYTPGSVLNEENTLNEMAAAEGISADFSSGDGGDYTYDIGPPYYPATVSAPADSPYATAVGGVSLALNSSNGIAWQAGWGNNETLLVDEGIFFPPLNFGFAYGSGGGPSAYFSKPSFQSALPGSWRLLPDISWLADPFTGGIIAISIPFYYPVLQWEVVGGTSLSCPMFSALWAIANQVAGKALGQAAHYLYTMPATTITDVVPVPSATNVTATIGPPTTKYTAAELAAPLEGTTAFYSALWDIPLYEDLVYLVTFGTDSGLKTTVGWDNVTGLGTPKGFNFAVYPK